MSQNLISLNLTDADYAEVDNALTALETKLAGLIDLDASERRTLSKMGEKSEAFCRQTLVVMQQNPGLIPSSVNLPEALRDLTQLDALRMRLTRMRQLIGRAEDSEMALGSDIMATSLEGYAMLKVLGKGSGLESLRRDMATRFARRSAPAAQTPVAAL